jgi:hypothetical protein
MNTVPVEGVLFVENMGVIHMIVDNSHYNGGMDYYTTPEDIEDFMLENGISLASIYEMELLDYNDDRSINIYFIEN